MILHDIPDEEYHARPEWSASDLKYLVNHSLDELEFHKKNQETTPAMELGSAFHMICLEPEKFKEKYVVEPEFEPTDGKEYKNFKNTNNYKEQYQKWLESVGDKKILSKEDFDKISAMAESLRKHPEWKKITMHQCYFEKVVFGELVIKLDDGTDKSIPLRIKADLICPDLNLIVDLKSTSDSTRKAFRNDVYKLNYDLQELIYKQVVQYAFNEEYKFIFFAVENKGKYTACAYETSLDIRQSGINKATIALEKVARNQRQRPEELEVVTL